MIINIIYYHNIKYFCDLFLYTGIRNGTVRKPFQSYTRDVFRIDRVVLGLLDAIDVYQSVSAARWCSRGAWPGMFRRPVARHIQFGVEGVRAHIS